MDVDSTLKINALMRELQKHGIAASSEQAFSQATEIVSGTAEVEDNGLVLEAPVQPQGALAERRVELLIEMSTKKLNEQVQEANNRVASLAMELEMVRADVRKLLEAKTQKIVQVVQEKQEALKTEPKTEHPRQGSFTPADVPIDKIFYFGHK
ncbi:hypothetical protein HY642_00710 [Candidatus Woesearchaeota archaeon]|nr:hypothetical protein [Candidatus Woesearchaeota archaeon]